MKKYLIGIYYSFPLQLVLLHFRKFQILLIFWVILFSTVNGGFMHSYGADSLYLAPEYRGHVNALAGFILGIAIGIFFMSWNITTFILFSRHFRFLATTSNPFLKYCINNSVIPVTFLVFYIIRAVQFEYYRELLSPGSILLIMGGFLTGLILLVLISFFYFFRADKTIIRRLTPVMNDPKLFKTAFSAGTGPVKLNESRLIKVQWYLNSFFDIKKPREVRHYSLSFIDTIFSRHHFAAVVSIFIAFLFLILMGFNLDSATFQLPAAASITLFFAILIALSGAFSYFLQSWSLPAAVIIFLFLNVLFQNGWLDPSNKAYGLNYLNKNERPVYDQQTIGELIIKDSVDADIRNMVAILEKWKEKQGEEKPVFYLLNSSGGGNRSANFTMNVMQRLDSISGGKLMDRVFMISGASGGMLGAAYYRELTKARARGVNPLLDIYIDDISQDLLNSIFTSLVARDLASPAQKFAVGDYEYIKDRGYAFERKLNENTRGLLNLRIKDIEEDERNARVPLMFFNSVITRDGRKMIVSSQNVRFLMRPYSDSSEFVPEPDAIDFKSLFRNQDPLNLRLLTALRMNATFPYVLPNVWLPTEPVIDVMDAGLRDNYGPETTVRFLQVFQDWLKENTSGVVLIQIRDRKTGGWDYPFTSENFSDVFSKPLLLLQYNWYKMQEYNQNDLLSFVETSYGKDFRRLVFQYSPKKEDAGAALNFHLTNREKLLIKEAIGNNENTNSFEVFRQLMYPKPVNELPRAELTGKPLAEQ